MGGVDLDSTPQLRAVDWRLHVTVRTSSTSFVLHQTSAFTRLAYIEHRPCPSPDVSLRSPGVQRAQAVCRQAFSRHLACVSADTKSHHAVATLVNRLPSLLLRMCRLPLASRMTAWSQATCCDSTQSCQQAMLLRVQQTLAQALPLSSLLLTPPRPCTCPLTLLRFDESARRWTRLPQSSRAHTRSEFCDTSVDRVPSLSCAYPSWTPSRSQHALQPWPS